MDCSLPGIGCTVHGILQARILKGVTMPSSRGSFQPRDGTQVSCIFCIAGRFFTTESPGEPRLCMLLLLLLSRFSRVRLCATPWTEAHQAPLSLGFSRQEYWSGLPFPSPMHEQEYWSGLPFSSLISWV